MAYSYLFSEKYSVEKLLNGGQKLTGGKQIVKLINGWGVGRTINDVSKHSPKRRKQGLS